MRPQRLTLFAPSVDTPTTTHSANDTPIRTSRHDKLSLSYLNQKHVIIVRSPNRQNVSQGRTPKRHIIVNLDVTNTALLHDHLSNWPTIPFVSSGLGLKHVHIIQGRNQNSFITILLSTKAVIRWRFTHYPTNGWTPITHLHYHFQSSIFMTHTSSIITPFFDITLLLSSCAI